MGPRGTRIAFPYRLRAAVSGGGSRHDVSRAGLPVCIGVTSALYAGGMAGRKLAAGGADMTEVVDSARVVRDLAGPGAHRSRGRVTTRPGRAAPSAQLCWYLSAAS